MSKTIKVDLIQTNWYIASDNLLKILNRCLNKYYIQLHDISIESKIDMPIQDGDPTSTYYIAMIMTEKDAFALNLNKDEIAPVLDRIFLELANDKFCA